MTFQEALSKKPGFESKGGATASEIDNAQKELGVVFSDEYKQFLETYGAIMYDGHHIVGIAKPLGLNVVRATKEQREYNGKAGINMYVIEEVPLDGIVYWQDQNGEIYVTVPGQAPEKRFDSLEAYILSD